MTEEEKYNNSKALLRHPTFLMVMSLVEQLNKQGILTENEIQSMTRTFYHSMTELASDKYEVTLLATPLVAMADRKNFNKIMSKFRNANEPYAKKNN